MMMMFEDSEFTQNIGSWNTTGVTNMHRMFVNATNFDQNLGSWSLESKEYMPSFAGSQLSTANYDAILVGWASQPVPNGIRVEFGSVLYSPGDAAVARKYLIDSCGWDINDGGLQP